MDANLIIDDTYVKNIGNQCRVRGRELDEILGKYITILAEIHQEAITGGEISDALEAFHGTVTPLKEHLTEISQKVDDLTEAFLTAVNTADDYLF